MRKRAGRLLPAAALPLFLAASLSRSAIASAPSPRSTGPAPASPLGSFSDKYFKQGECLLRHLPGCGDPPSLFLPSSVLLPVFLSGHRRVLEHWRQIRLGIEAALMFSLACVLEGPLAALLLAPAAAVYVWAAPPGSNWPSWLFGEGPYVEEHYLLFVLLAALLLAWRARHPSPARSLLAALGLGSALLFRSSLVFFPAFAAFFDLSVRPAASRRRLLSVLILLVVPYLFLLPWIRMNWRALHQFVPLEFGQFECNTATGALGIVHSVEGPWTSLAAPAIPSSGGGVSRGGELIGWAARQVLAHPKEYALSCAKRLAFVVSLWPLLFIAAVLGLWLCWERPESRETGLLLAYYVGVHCLMSVQSSYLIPVAPLLLVMAAAGAARLIGWDRRAGWLKAAGDALSAGATAAVLSAALALSAYSWGRVEDWRSAAGGRPLSQEDLGRLIATNQGDPWLWAARGEVSLQQGRWEQASRDLSRALALGPRPERWRLEKAWALARLGRPRDLLEGRYSERGAPLLAAAEYLRLGNKAAAWERLRRSVSGEGQALGLSEETSEPPGPDKAAARRLHAEGLLWCEDYEWAFDLMPRGRRLAVEIDLLSFFPETGFIRGVRSALEAASRGRRKLALAELERQRSLGKGIPSRSAMIGYWERQLR